MIEPSDKRLLRWRQIIKQNAFNAKVIILLFIMMSAIIGFAIDFSLAVVVLGENIRDAFKLLMTLKLPLYGTIAVPSAGGLLLLGLYGCQQRLMLMGLPVTMLSSDSIQTDKELQVYKVVEDMASAMEFTSVPTVGIAEVAYPNAFAVGAGTKKTIVLTRGLVDELTALELQAVIAVELCQIKLNDPLLTWAVAAVSHLALILFDGIYHPYLYGKYRDEEPSPFRALVCKGLQMARFMLPLGTFLFRFILSPGRFHIAEQLAVKLLKDNQALASALIKITNLHFEQMDTLGRAYSEVPYDEIRRESYFFDPADITAAQTFAAPFTTHPSLEERLMQIGVAYEPSMLSQGGIHAKRERVTAATVDDIIDKDDKNDAK